MKHLNGAPVRTVPPSPEPWGANSGLQRQREKAGGQQPGAGLQHGADTGGCSLGRTMPALGKEAGAQEDGLCAASQLPISKAEQQDSEVR